MGRNSTAGRLAAQPPRQHDRGSYLIAIGVITRPHNFNRRAWMREHAPATPELLLRFVLGHSLAASVSILLDEEHRVYGDLHRFKHAKDGFRSAHVHAHVHVIKTYEWCIYAKGLATRSRVPRVRPGFFLLTSAARRASKNDFDAGVACDTRGYCGLPQQQCAHTRSTRLTSSPYSYSYSY